MTPEEEHDFYGQPENQEPQGAPRRRTAQRTNFSRDPSDPFAANRAHVRKKFAAKLGYLERMIDCVADEINPWAGKPLESKADRIIALVLSRSLTTARAVVCLAEAGFGTHGAMLNRALFEDLIDAGWTVCNPDAAAKMHSAHERREQLALRVSLEKLPATSDASFEPLTAEEVAELADETRFGRYGERHWTGVSLHARIDAAKGAWEEHELVKLRTMYELAHHRNNLLLHSSPLAHNQHLAEDAPGYLKTFAGPSTVEMDRTLFGAAWTIGAVGLLVMQHFDFPRAGEFADWRERQERRALSPEIFDLGEVDRNDPCPCGSGDKCKRCHGVRE